MFLKISQISQESLFQKIEKGLQLRYFPIKFAKFFRTPFFTEHRQSFWN